jgi:FkbM family methyltransferase
MKDKMIKENPTLYNELFVMNINQVEPIEIKNKTIIDIGGHLGYFSILCSYFDPKEIYTFEPVEIFYDKLLDFVKDIKNIHTYNLAVLDKSIDYVSMDIDGEASHIWGNGKKDVKCISLEDIVNDYITDKNNNDLVLKLDCEGSEFNILYNTPNHILKRFSTMYIEFHDEMNPDYQYKTNDIIEKITNLGYDKYKGVQSGYYDENNNFTPSPISIWKFKRKNNENMKVTATISTRNRYFTTLPLCIHSIATQTYRPSELIIYDDNEDDKRIDLRNDPIYSTLFKLLEINGISWRVIFGKGEGQVKNHQLALKDSNYDFIWRLDDDNVPESNVLETLVKNINDKTGAIGGLIIDPNNITSNSKHSNLIKDIDIASNEQWNIESPKFDYKIVDHLYSSFLFRKEAGMHGYNMNLSRVGHREETMFTYEMKLQGWEIAINSKCITWHYHNPFGGIRDNTVKEMWDHDENIFRNKLKEWNIYNDNNFIDIVLDNGIGDHYAFKMILNELNEKNKKINLYCCFPEVFADDNVKLYSIHDALVKYNNNISQFNIYKWMDEMNWKGTLLEAFKKLYL